MERVEAKSRTEHCLRFSSDLRLDSFVRNHLAEEANRLVTDGSTECIVDR